MPTPPATALNRPAEIAPEPASSCPAPSGATNCAPVLKGWRSILTPSSSKKPFSIPMKTAASALEPRMVPIVTVSVPPEPPSESLPQAATDSATTAAARIAASLILCPMRVIALSSRRFSSDLNAKVRCHRGP
jgi:hypothetical protein